MFQQDTGIHSNARNSPYIYTRTQRRISSASSAITLFEFKTYKEGSQQQRHVFILVPLKANQNKNQTDYLKMDENSDALFLHFYFLFIFTKKKKCGGESTSETYRM